MIEKENVPGPGQDLLDYSSIKILSQIATSEIAHHEHVSRVKLARAKYLLWKKKLLLSKLSQIEDELAAMSRME